ncbi:hypothetical protein Trydic_g22353 [Trypoxylus dichotomus]
MVILYVSSAPKILNFPDKSRPERKTIGTSLPWETSRREPIFCRQSEKVNTQYPPHRPIRTGSLVRLRASPRSLIDPTTTVRVGRSVVVSPPHPRQGS